MHNKRLMFKLSALALAAVFAFAACGTATDAGADDETAAPAEPAAQATTQNAGETATGTAVEGYFTHVDVHHRLQGQLPVWQGAEPFPISIGIRASLVAEDHDTNWLTLYLQERMNVDLTFDVFPMDTADATTRFTLMVAGGQELPDATMLPFNELQVSEFARMGVFIPLTEMLNDPSIAVNVWEMEDWSRNDMFRDLTFADGEIYSLPTYARPNSWSEFGFRVWINQEWMQNLGYTVPDDIPVYTGDFRDMMYRFVNDDPNGDGQSTIGVMGAGVMGSNHVIPFIINAFTYANPNRQWRHVENGVIYSSLFTPGFRDGMEFIAGMVADGLIDFDSFVQSFDELRAIAQTPDRAIVGVIPGGSYSQLFGGTTGPILERYHLMKPLRGPEGVSYTPVTIPLPSHDGMQITRDAAHPAETLMFGDFFFSDYGQRTWHSGEYGHHWTSDPDVLATWVGRFMDVPESLVVFRETNVWGQPGNTIWAAGPRYQRWSVIRAEGLMPRDEYEVSVIGNWNRLNYEWYSPHSPAENIGRWVFTEEETEEMANIEPMLLEHINANLAAFAVGQRPISDYDAFLGELEAFGMTRYLQLSQNAFNRANGLAPIY